MRDINIFIKDNHTVDFENDFIGLNLENLQGNIIFNFDKFIEGTARVETIINNQDGYILLDRVGQTYTLPIKSSLLTGDSVLMQVVIDEPGIYNKTTDTTIDIHKTYFEKVGESYVVVLDPTVEEIENYYEVSIPVWKSEVFYLKVGQSINATTTIPEDYPTWIQVIDSLINQTEQAITRAGNLDITATQTETGAEITITNQDQEQTTVEVQNGVSLEDIEIDNNDLKVTYGGSTENLGQVCPVITIGTTTTGLPNTQASVTNTGTALNPIFNFTIPKGEAGSIKFEIVNELPSTGADDTIYLVPITPDVSGNNYAEYIYINGAWELLGKIGVQVDLSGYYTKTETDNLLQNKVGFTDYATNDKGGVFKLSSYYAYGLNNDGTMYSATKTYSNYNSGSNGMFISKGTLENVITGKGLTTKSYVDGLVGDINSVLDAINGEVI